MRWKPQQNWNWLEDKSDKSFSWRKELREDCLGFVCRFENKEIGLVPLEYNHSNTELKQWWKKAYDTHPDGIILQELMNEIMARKNFQNL
jgi:hypothetical protein